MKINNYPTYLKKDWKNNKGRFVNINTEPNEFILPIDDVSVNIIKYYIKIKQIVEKEYKKIHTHAYYNAELK